MPSIEDILVVDGDIFVYGISTEVNASLKIDLAYNGIVFFERCDGIRIVDVVFFGQLYIFKEKIFYRSPVYGDIGTFHRQIFE